MSITAYKDHPLSELLPLMEDAEIEDLATDIRQNGQRAPITLYENKILDGRNRYRACKIANVEPKVRHFTSGDAVAFILSANVFRRHLTTSQRALVAAKMASNGHGPSSAILHRSPSIPEVAKELKVSPRTVKTAKEVLRTAPRREVQAIEKGKKTVATVARETKKKAEAKAVHLDKTGYVIPEQILEDWNRATDTGKKWLQSVSTLRSELKTSFEEEDLILAEITNTTIADLNNAYTSIKCIVPYAVCTSCQGVQRKKCALCKRRGFLSEFAWRSYVPAEDKKMREQAK